MVVNVCQLATQTQAKQEIKKTFKGSYSKIFKTGHKLKTKSN